MMPKLVKAVHWFPFSARLFAFTLTPATILLSLLVFMPVANAVELTCGSVIGQGESVVLTADVGPCDGDAGVTLEDNARLNMNGYMIFCEEMNGDGELPNAIELEGSSTVVINGIVRDCKRGVRITGTGEHQIRSITARHNTDQGFSVKQGSNNNRLRRNHAIENGKEGFNINGSKNHLSFNRSVHNEKEGFEVEHDGNRLTKNTAYKNGNEGFQIEGSDNLLIRNRSVRNEDDGIKLLQGKGNQVLHNTALSNAKDGFQIGGVGNRVHGNIAIRNKSDGIINFGNEMEITRNITLFNGENGRGSGIDVDIDATDNKIFKNFALGNSEVDLEDNNVNCDNNKWSSNKFVTSNQDCID